MTSVKNAAHLQDWVHLEALQKNAAAIDRWQKYRDDHMALGPRLKSFRDELKLPMMVPIGPKAFMKGRLVHTNEVLISLGDDWFTKQSATQAAALCTRRVRGCDEMLTKLNRERELLLARRNIPCQLDAFGGGETLEIVEEYNEEQEAVWRAEHRSKEKEYRQKLAELKKADKPAVECEADLFNRLDMLALQEELEEELDRLGVDSDEEEEEEEESDTEGEQREKGKENCKMEKGAKDRIQVDKNVIFDPTEINMYGPSEDNRPKRRVSFVDTLSTNNIYGEVEDDENSEVIRIEFKHSKMVDQNNKMKPNQDNVITSPADIYKQYQIEMKTVPKSILKKTSSFGELQEEQLERRSEKSDATIRHMAPMIQAVGDVIQERIVTTSCEESASAVNTTSVELSQVRRVSKFKASREMLRRGHT